MIFMGERMTKELSEAEKARRNERARYAKNMTFGYCWDCDVEYHFTADPDHPGHVCPKK